MVMFLKLDQICSVKHGAYPCFFCHGIVILGESMTTNTN